MVTFCNRAALLVALALFASVACGQCLNNCAGHGSCIDGACTCEQGWTGQDCSTYSCGDHTDGCSGQGQCSPSGCVCFAGFGGFNCASVTTNCPNNCKGHGSCLDGVCTCDLGYQGVDCGSVNPAYSCPMNCSGHGFCGYSGETPTCTCMPFWTGAACDIQLSQCPDELNNCTGHGICGPMDPSNERGVWLCTCEPGFCGSSCNSACPSCLNNCTGHGICYGSVCTCDLGFSGTDCSRVVAIPECPNGCSGHGRCSETGANTYQCVCEPGYEGASCGVVVAFCPQNCSGKGECMPDGSCACISGFNGTACEQALGTCAATNNCSGNGICGPTGCACYQGFSGFDCSNACHVGGLGNIGCNADKGHGVCLNGTCVCKEGEWEGEGCEIESNASDFSKLTTSSNPVGLIVLSVVGAASAILLAGFWYNHSRKGKRGLNAVPGISSFRSRVVTKNDFEDEPEKRYSSIY